MVTALFPHGSAFWISFGDAVAEGLIVSGLVALIVWLANAGDRRSARLRIAQHVCRVFGMRLRARAGQSSLEPLPADALQGWAALPHLASAIDLNRSALRASLYLQMQDVIDELNRGAATPRSLNDRMILVELPRLTKRLLPRRVRRAFKEHLASRGISELAQSLRTLGVENV